MENTKLLNKTASLRLSFLPPKRTPFQRGVSGAPTISRKTLTEDFILEYSTSCKQTMKNACLFFLCTANTDFHKQSPLFALFVFVSPFFSSKPCFRLDETNSWPVKSRLQPPPLGKCHPLTVPATAVAKVGLLCGQISGLFF